MVTTLESIAHDALILPPADRLALARRLLESVELDPEPEDEVDLVDHAADADNATDARRLRRAVERLPVLQRNLLSLYHFDDMSIPEIALVTGLAAGTIKSHLFRSRLKLKELLESGAEQ